MHLFSKIYVYQGQSLNLLAGYSFVLVRGTREDKNNY